MIDQAALDEIRSRAKRFVVPFAGAPATAEETIALLDALEEARLVARKATVELSALRRTYTGLRKEAEAARLERDTLRDEVKRLREALKDAQTELFEAADKFHVIGVNHPGSRLCNKPESLTAKHLDEDKAFMVKLADRMTLAARRARETIKEAGCG